MLTLRASTCSFDLQLHGEKHKAAHGGELINEKMLTNVTWPVWRKQADQWHTDQAKYMPLLGVKAAETTVSQRKDADGMDGDANDDNNDDDNDEERGTILVPELIASLAIPTNLHLCIWTRLPEVSRAEGRSYRNRGSSWTVTSLSGRAKAMGLRFYEHCIRIKYAA